MGNGNGGFFWARHAAPPFQVFKCSGAVGIDDEKIAN